MADKKVYTIEINGIKESANAVEALNKQLNELENRIKKLESSNVKVNTSSSGGSSKSTSAMNEETKLAKQIEAIDAKREAYSKEIYQNYLAAKDVLDETVKDQKQLAASERLQADAYSKNTMAGLKAKLKDIQTIRNTVELSSDEYKKLTAEANKLNQKLKELEAETGSYGRNVGNYASAFDKVKVAVGNTVREYDNYKKAVKELKQERFQLSKTLGQESEQYKEVDKALKQLVSDYKDLDKSSAFMDNLLDTMQSFTALASVGQGVSALFGFDDDKIQKSIQKLMALQNILKGIETIQLQMQSGEGFGKLFNAGSQSVDKFVAKLTGAKIAEDGLTASSRGATIAVRGLSAALKSIGIGFIIAAIPEIINGLTNIAKEMTSTESKTNLLDEALASLNNRFKDRNDLLASSYLKGEINDNELLTKAYATQSDYLSEQIVLLRERAALMNEQNEGGFFNWGFMDSFTKGGGFTGERMNGSKTVESYSWLSDLIPQLSITVNNVKEVEEEFKKCQIAINDTQDYFSKWGNGLVDYVNSLFTSISDTERVMRGLGNTRLNEFVGSFAEANQKFKEGKISAEEYAKELGKLKGELNSSEVLRSVIANLDKYIPDEKVREAVNNIINQIIRLDDAFNMTSPEQVRHWMQVRIDAMAEGTDKIKAQIDADEKYEIAQYGKTQEQINLIHAKYNRKRQDELKKYNEQAKEKAKKQAKELEAVEKELNSLRIENMKEGLDKQLAQLEEERRQKLQAAKDNGIKVGELTIEINKLYDKKVADAKKEWAYKVEQVYIDMWNKIYQLNHKNAQREYDNQLNEIENEYKKLKDVLSNEFGNVGEDYSNKGYTVEKKPKRNKEATSTDSSDFKYKILVEKEEEYTKRLREEFAIRTEERKKYYSEIQALEIQEEDKSYAISIQKLEENKNNELRTLKNSYAKEDHELEAHYKNGEISLEQYNEAVNRLNKERATQEAGILSQYQIESEEKEREHNDKIADIKQKSNNSILKNYREFMEKLSNIDTSSSVRTKAGFIDIGATRKRNKELIDAYKQLSTDLNREISNLQKKLDGKDLTEKQREEIQNLINQYRQLQQQIGLVLIEIDNNTKASVQEFIGELNQYVQTALQSIQEVLSAVWDAQDAAYEAQMEKLEKQIDEYEELLRKQDDIVQEHANTIQSIEESLSSARGDARQRLIDQINEEMAAQRRELAEKKRIEKEEEKLKKKKEKEELDQKKREKNRAIVQALINTALSISMAAVNSWPMPAIAMMAAAAAVGAAQVAAISSQKYAKGGLLNGKSHAEGGIPVGNTGIEVEGNEYVVRKSSTTPNVELLDYINKSQRKLNLDDFIDFYTSGKVKNSFAASQNTKFAEGGTLPTLNNDYSFDDRLLTAFEDYSNRPVQVSVVDINNRQEAVKAVQVLAGMEV